MLVLLRNKALKRLSYIIFLLATVAVTLGAWAKITHQSFADPLLAFGIIAELFAVVIFLVANYLINRGYNN